VAGILLFNAVVGILLLEITWHNTRRHRNPPSRELNSKFAAYYRLDAERWAKYKFYPGAMLLLVPRLILAFLVAIPMLFMAVKILLIRHREDEPVLGLKKALLKGCYQLAARMSGLLFFSTWY
jgi:hypothetical protein